MNKYKFNIDSVINSKDLNKLPPKEYGRTIMIIRGIEFYYLYKKLNIPKKETKFNFNILTSVLKMYWRDRMRIVYFHKLQKIDEMKVAGHFTYWLTKLKPVQVLNDKHILINEQLAVEFSLGIIQSCINSKPNSQNNFKFDIENQEWRKFIDEIVYSLRFRIITQDMISLIYKGVYLQS